MTHLALRPSYTNAWHLMRRTESEIGKQKGIKVISVKLDEDPSARTAPLDFIDFNDVAIDLLFTDNDDFTTNKLDASDPNPSAGRTMQDSRLHLSLTRPHASPASKHEMYTTASAEGAGENNKIQGAGRTKLELNLLSSASAAAAGENNTIPRTGRSNPFLSSTTGNSVYSTPPLGRYTRYDRGWRIPK